MGRRASRRGTLLAALAVALLAPAASADAAKGGKLRLDVLSSEAGLVTGGDALVEVAVPKGTKAAKVRIVRNGRNVTGAFEPGVGDRRRLVGLVGGLRKGANLILAREPGSNRPAKLTLFNSPSAGPLISGQHQEPFICTTEAAGLGPATDANCLAPTQIEYRYRSTGGSFKPLADPAARPADLAQTTTREGETVDYVIRIESGVINRSIYRWAILAPGGEVGQGWNERFVYSFGGGCSAGHQQGESNIGSVLDDRDLSRGYSTISSSLNVLNTACNDVLSAETAAMVKEHVIESLGRPPVWTVGEGGSGGSVQQQMIAQNYPGLLDGLIPAASFPDNSSSAYPDCRLLNAYFATPDGSALSPAQRSAITGMDDPNACQALGGGADVVNATEGCIESVVPVALIYDPVTNPGGARCTVWDSLVNVYGRDPATGFARRTLDNVGRQYGLLALQEGTISKGEFLDLNEAIGGYDNDGNLVASRAVADPEALAIAYRTGRINRGAGGMADVPIIDIRDYVDDEVNVHQYVNTFITRARLDRTNGTHANQVMFRTSGNNNTRLMNDAAIDIMGAWLDRIEADGSDRPLSEKVIASKPADAVDACWIGGVRIDDPAVVNPTGPCAQFAPHSLPANRAGLPLDSLVVKCQTKAVDAADYNGLSPAQSARMAAIFPSGVCDHSRPGVGETELGGTWQEFGPERKVKQRKRKLRLKVAMGKGAKVTLSASLRPCPEANYQRVTFERRAGKRWRAIGTEVATGRKCRAKLTTRVDARTKVRAVAKKLDGYRGTKSKPRAVKRRGR